MDIEKNLKTFDEMILKGQAAWWQMDLPSGKVIFGDAKAEMIGFSPEKFKVYQDFTSLLHPDDYPKAMNAMKDHLEGKAPYYETLYRIKNVNGEYVTFYDFGQIIKKDGANITTIGFVKKVNDINDLDNEIKIFKELVSSGKTSLAELFSKARAK